MHFINGALFLLIVIASSSCQKLWHSNFMGLSDKPRNEFILRNVSLDQKFSLNTSVDYWRSLNTRFSSFAVGVSEGNILVLNVTKTEDPREFNINWKSKGINDSFKDASLVNVPYGNEEQGGYFFVGISSERTLCWFDIKNLDLTWTWGLGYEADTIKFGYNNVLNRYQIFLSSSNTLYIYNFDVERKKLWLAETLELPGPIGIFDTIPFRDGFHLLLPQKSVGQLFIYRYVDGHFKTFKNLTAEGIDRVVAFEINFKSFFAVDGLDSGIYQFHQRDKIRLETIANSHFEGIKYWFPVKVNNLRKNFILFGQRVLHHGSLKSLVTETFIYNGETFEEHEDIPCKIFGEEFNSLNCLVSSQDSVGIHGAAAISAGNNLGLLLAKRSPHNLFRVNFEVRDVKSPVQEKMTELEGIRTHLQKLLDERMKNKTDPIVSKTPYIEPNQGDIVATSASHQNEKLPAFQSEKGAPIVGVQNKEILAQRIDQLLARLEQLKEKLDKVEAMEKAGNFKKMIFSGKTRVDSVWVEKVNTKIVNDEPVEEVLRDVVRRNRTETVKGTKTFTDLNVKNLFFSSLNGIKSENLMFHDSDNVVINGNVIFEKPVAVMRDIKADLINGMPSSSIPNLNEHIDGTLSFEKLNVYNMKPEEDGVPELDSSDSLKLKDSHDETSLIYFPNNITVKKINGEDFEELLKQLCLVNIPNHIAGTVVVKGDVTFDAPSFVDKLNDIHFPEDYVLESAKMPVFISGKKTFKNSLMTNILNTNGHYINEFKSDDFFTLSTSQNVYGNASFPSLEITKQFLHDGKTIGKELKNLLPNPTLSQTFNISASVNFEALEVTGSVIVENMDGFNYGRILEDIVYKDEENPVIQAIKEFSEGLTIRNNLEISSNSINRVPLDQIVTQDTPQFLNVPQLNGNVSIENMNIQQFINGINITKLEQESVKTFGEQFISSFLIFEEDLEAENLEVKERLNEISVENFYLTTGDRIIAQKSQFNEIQTDTLSVSKNVEGTFIDFDFRNFTKNRLTYTTPQNITEDVNLVNSRTGRIGCQADIDLCQVVLNEKKMMDSMMLKVSSGRIPVKELLVKDDLKIEQINGMPLSQVQEMMKKSSVLDGNVYFTNLNASKLSGVSIQELLQESVFKNDTDIEIKGLKVFEKGILVKKLIETDKLNDVPIENLMTKQGDQIIESPLEIFGNVTFKSDVNILETINDVPVQQINDFLEYKDDIYYIKADILFNRLTYIRDLDVFGNINEKNFDDVLSNIAYLDENLQFSDEIAFTGPVEVNGDLDIKNHFNGISMSENNDNIVYLNKITDNTIESPVTFTGENVFAHNLLIETNLLTKWMRGLNLDIFRRNAIFLNQGFLKGTYTFQNMALHEKLITNFINNVDMSKLIPLGTDQEINRLLIDNVVFLNNVTVEDSVNGFKLIEELNKCVLSNVDQAISSELYFKNNTLIRHNLEVGGLLNGNPIDKVVTTDTNQTLTATYNFSSKTVLEANMYATGFVNSINMSDWENGALKLVSKEPQVIVAPWYFGKNLSFEDSLDCENGIYGFDVEEELQLMREEKDYKSRMDIQYDNDHKSICRDIHALNKESKKQTYKFENMEEMLQFEYRKVIGKAHFFNFGTPSMILNGVDSCSVDIFNLEDGTFVKDTTFDIGEIDQIITVRDDDCLFFVVKTKFNNKCDSDVDGTIIWQFKNDTMLKIQNIDKQHILQESLVPLTFYGLNKNGVTEFRIDMSKAIPVAAYRKWKIREENAAFMPRGMGTGLAVRTGRKIIKLIREEPLIDNEVDFESATIKGDMKVFDNTVVPGRNNSKMTVVNVGPKGLRKTFLAIVFHEDTVVGRNFDVLKIYEDYAENRIFQEISTYNPTSLVSLEMDNGETLLLILENEEKLQIYRYRGIEGFRRYLSAELSGSHMFKMSLPVGPNGGLMDTLAVVKREKITILKPVMTGNPPSEQIECS